MAEKDPGVPMTKMYVIFESEFPTEQFPTMRERVERLGAHLARISMTNEQLSIFSFDAEETSETADEETDWLTIDQWTNNYLLDYLRVHPSDRPGTWPTRAWRKMAHLLDPNFVKEDPKGEVSLHRDGITGFAEQIKQGSEKGFTGAKSKELLFMFVRNTIPERTDSQETP